jgi:hypothetical protein
MNRVIKIAFVVLIAVSSAGLSFTPLASAQTDNLVVEFERTPLFNETNFLPGQGVTRWVKVTNNSGQTQRIAVETINENDPDNLGGQLNLVIRESGSIRCQDTLASFFSAGETYLSDLNNGATTQYDFTITFNSASGNPYQGRILGFDILVGFQGTEGGLPPAPPGGDGGGGGGSLPPGLSILDESVRVTNIGETSVTIIWTTSYFSTSYVIYGTGAEAHTLDLSDNTGTPPKYGYAHATPEYDTSPKVTAHSVTITGLNPATTYYFRAVSHASLAISQQFSFTTSEFTEQKIGEIKGEEPISLQSEGIPPEGVPLESGEGEFAGEKGTESLVTEGKRSWFDDLIKGGLLAAIGLVPFNFKSILFLLLIIIAVLIILKLITKRKREKK